MTVEEAIRRLGDCRDDYSCPYEKTTGYRLSFVEHFGPRPSASAIRKQAEQRTPVVRPIHF